jgi:hypothetical protein
MTNLVSIRLNNDELQKLDEMAGAGNAGTAGPVEFFRLLLHREWNRRHNLPKPEAKDWQTAFRQGRPIKVQSPMSTRLRQAMPRREVQSLVIFLLCVSASLRLSAAPISNSDAVRAIVGEAAGQPYIVKLAVAEAIHNRGTLCGVYGLNAAHNRTEPAWVWRDGRRAWAQSKTTAITHGATHFGNRSDVLKGTFTGLKLTCVLGTGRDATYFFKV